MNIDEAISILNREKHNGRDNWERYSCNAPTALEFVVMSYPVIAYPWKYPDTYAYKFTKREVIAIAMSYLLKVEIGETITLESALNNLLTDANIKETEVIILGEPEKKAEWKSNRCQDFVDYHTANLNCMKYQCVGEAGHKAMHWATNHKGERINW